MEIDPSMAVASEDPANDAPQMDEPSVFLAVVEDGPNVAFCAYDEEMEIISIETVQANGFEAYALISSILACLRPTLLLLSRRIVGNPSLLQAITTPVGITSNGTSTGVDDGTVSSSIPYKIIKSSWLDLTKARQMVLRLRVKSLMARAGISNRQGRARPLLEQNHNNVARTFSVPHYNALASVIDFDSKVLIQALGALLYFLQGTVVLLNQPVHPRAPYHKQNMNSDSDGTELDCLYVSHLKLLQIDQYVHIPSRTLQDLHIFHTDHHPLALAAGSQSSKGKEGYSLMSWLDRTHFSDARLRLREWMHQPLRGVERIRQRQDGVALFASPRMANLAGRLAQYSRHLNPSVPSIMARLAKSSNAPKDFVKLCHSLEHALAMCECLETQVLWKLQQWHAEELARQPSQMHSQQRRIPDDEMVDPTADENTAPHDSASSSIASYAAFVESILDRCHTTALRSILQRTTGTLDLASIAETSQLAIRDGVDAQLDQRRAQLALVPSIVGDASRSVCARFPALVAASQTVGVVFYPQVGYLVVVRQDPIDAYRDTSGRPMDARSHQQASYVSGHQYIYDDSGDEEMRLEWVFRTGNNNFYKTKETITLDMEIGDLDLVVKSAEMMVASRLEDEIVQSDVLIRQTFSALADLDCILAFAEIAVEHGLVRPLVVPAEEHCILIERGGHPLQEQTLAPGTFVRNDTEILDDFRVNVVSGPNYSGKSCYARQVGVLTYMAHLGCYLPCAAARISVVDRILTQFSGPETCLVPQSSFQLDLSNMGGILRTATRHSLVLIDEFGKGTSPASGLALLAAALRGLAERGCRVVCTTHFREVLSDGRLLQDGTGGVRALQMAVELPDRAEDPGGGGGGSGGGVEAGDGAADDEDEAAPPRTAAPLFRLLPGHSAGSAGLACARLCGVKGSVVARAAALAAALRGGRAAAPLREVLHRALAARLRGGPEAAAVLAAFLVWDWAVAPEDELVRLRAALVAALGEDDDTESVE